MLVVLVLSMVALAVVTWQLAELTHAVQRACDQDSVVARLDLTEWVEPCRMVQ